MLGKFVKLLQVNLILAGFGHLKPLCDISIRILIMHIIIMRRVGN